MIGGFDTVIEGPVEREDVDVLLRLLRAEWPDGVLESSDGVTVIALLSAPGKRSIENEFFVYRDEESKSSWDERGLTEDNGDTMISVTIAGDYIALVAGDPSSASGQLAQWTRDTIRQCRLGRRLLGQGTSSRPAPTSATSEQV